MACKFGDLWTRHQLSTAIRTFMTQSVKRQMGLRWQDTTITRPSTRVIITVGDPSLTVLNIINNISLDEHTR